MDERLLRELREFDLRFTCDHCAHHAPQRDECSLGFPQQEHRTRDLTGEASLTFCKTFELG